MKLRDWIESDDLQISYIMVHKMAKKLGLNSNISSYHPHIGDEKKQIDQKCSAIITQFQIQFGLDEEIE